MGPSPISGPRTRCARAGTRGPILWLLLDANRFALLAALVLAVFVTFVAVGVVTDPSLATKLRSADTVETIVSTMIGVLLTGTTLVVTSDRSSSPRRTGRWATSAGG